MKTTQNIEDINKIIRTVIIEQSGVPGQFVRDAVYNYGAMLDRNVDGSVFNGIEPSNTMILFELTSRKADYAKSETLSNGNVCMYCGLTFHIIMYGDNTSTLANVLGARLRTEAVRTDLYSKGVYIEAVSTPTEIHEFLNSKVWLRNDFDLDIACYMEIEQVSDNSNFNELGELRIYTT